MARNYDQVGLEAEIKGIESYLTSLRRMQQGNEQFNKSLDTVANQAAATSKGFATAVQSMSQVAARSLAGAAGAGTKMALDFDKSMRFVNTIAKLPEQGFNDLKNQVVSLSNDIGLSSQSLADGLYQALSAGVPAGEAMQFLATSSKAAVAGLTTTEVAVDGITTVLNSFRMETSEAGRVADIMFKTVELGKTTFPELANFMYDVAPAAAAASIKFEEVGAALATLTANGVPTRVATTQVRQAIISLQKPTEEMQQIFKDLGYASAQQAIEQKGLAFAMEAVRTAADGDNGKLQQLVGSVEGVQAILGTTGPNAQRFAGFLDDVANSTGSVDSAFKEVEKSGSRKLQHALVQIQNLGIRLGEQFLPLLEDAADLTSKAVDALGGFGDWFETIPGPLQDVGRGLGLVSVAVGTLGVALKAANLTMGTSIDLTPKFAARLTALASAAVLGYQAGQQLREWIGLADDEVREADAHFQEYIATLRAAPPTADELRATYKRVTKELAELTKATGGYESASDDLKQKMDDLGAEHVALETVMHELGVSQKDEVATSRAVADAHANVGEAAQRAAQTIQEHRAAIIATRTEAPSLTTVLMELADANDRIRQTADEAKTALYNMIREPSAEANKRELQISLLELNRIQMERSVLLLNQNEAQGKLTAADAKWRDQLVNELIPATQGQIDVLKSANDIEAQRKDALAKTFVVLDDTVKKIMEATGETAEMSRGFRGEMPKVAQSAESAFGTVTDTAGDAEQAVRDFRGEATAGTSVNVDYSQLQVILDYITRIREAWAALTNLWGGSRPPAGATPPSTGGVGAGAGLAMGSTAQLEETIKAALSLVERFQQEASRLGGSDKIQPAQDLAQAIGTIASALQEAATALDAIKAWKSFEVAETKITKLLDNAQMIVRAVVGIAGGFKGKALEKAADFASALGTISGVFDTATEGFDNLKAWKRFDISASKIRVFLENAREIVRAVVEVAITFKQRGLGKAIEFADTLQAIGGSIGNAVEGFDNLRAWEAWAAPERKVRMFVATGQAIVDAIVAAGRAYRKRGLEKGSRFSEALAAIGGNINEAVEGFDRLKAWKSISIGERKIQIFVENALNIVRAIVDVAQHFKRLQAFERASEFAGAIGSIGGAIGQAVDGFNKLRAWEAFELTDRKIGAFVKNAFAITRAMANVAARFKHNGLEKAQEFAAAASAITGIVGGALDAFERLSRTEVRRIGARKLDRLVDNLRQMVRDFTNAAVRFKPEALAAAKAFAEAILPIAQAITATVDAFAAVMIMDLFDKHRFSMFVDDMVDAALIAIRKLRTLPKTAAQEAAEIATAVGTIIQTTANAYELLTKGGLASLEGLAGGFNFQQVTHFLEELVRFGNLSVQAFNSFSKERVGDASDIASMLQIIFATIREGLQLAIPLSGGQAGLPAFASGGVTPGGPVLVGERGPELAMLPAGTRISPSDETRRLIGALHGLSARIPAMAMGGGGGSVHNNSWTVNANYARPEEPQGIGLTMRMIALRAHR